MSAADAHHAKVAIVVIPMRRYLLQFPLGLGSIAAGQIPYFGYRDSPFAFRQGMAWTGLVLGLGMGAYGLLATLQMGRTLIVGADRELFLRRRTLSLRGSVEKRLTGDLSDLQLEVSDAVPSSSQVPYVRDTVEREIRISGTAGEMRLVIGTEWLNEPSDMHRRFNEWQTGYREQGRNSG